MSPLCRRTYNSRAAFEESATSPPFVQTAVFSRVINVAREAQSELLARGHVFAGRALVCQRERATKQRAGLSEPRNVPKLEAIRKLVLQVLRQAQQSVHGLLTRRSFGVELAACQSLCDLLFLLIQTRLQPVDELLFCARCWEAAQLERSFQREHVHVRGPQRIAFQLVRSVGRLARRC